MSALAQWQTLQDGLTQLRSGGLAAHGLSELARSQEVLLETLGPRYREVLLQLLDRLESSALFSEESCSFSQQGLLDNLQVWLDKAQGQLKSAA
ncbi:hypothetical protein [Rhodoferax sp.]|uniref:hypothetical protein n=1 Tax=Rhodoferax sp. TaxID=50421 RepID=UPI002ACEE1EA|nr:hypothetical protein [Rhodoferax sp.]MDZ7920044.1 hypothetical protein [Rhodoferax sp.]